MSSAGHPAGALQRVEGRGEDADEVPAVELSHRRIRANAVALGPIATSFIPDYDLRRRRPGRSCRSACSSTASESLEDRRGGGVVPALGRGPAHHRRLIDGGGLRDDRAADRSGDPSGSPDRRRHPHRDRDVGRRDRTARGEAFRRGRLPPAHARRRAALVVRVGMGRGPVARARPVVHGPPHRMARRATRARPGHASPGRVARRDGRSAWPTSWRWGARTSSRSRHARSCAVRLARCDGRPDAAGGDRARVLAVPRHLRPRPHRRVRDARADHARAGRLHRAGGRPARDLLLAGPGRARGLEPRSLDEPSGMGLVSGRSTSSTGRRSRWPTGTSCSSSRCGIWPPPNGMAATFMAKPFPDTTGSSCHLHLSLLDVEAANVFGEGSSGETCAAAARRHRRLLARAPELMLWYAPTVNSYRRIAGRRVLGQRTELGLRQPHGLVPRPGRGPRRRPGLNGACPVPT